MGACTPVGERRESTTVTRSAEPRASATAAVTEGELREALAVRGRFGLRADEAWIRAVAADPGSQRAKLEFGIPLTPAEFEDLMTRRWDDELLARVQSYGGAFPDAYSGAYPNLEGSGVVVEFTRDIDRHRRALAALAQDPTLVVVRQVEWTKLDFARFAASVEAERAWFEANGLVFRQAVRSELDQFVRVDVEGPSESTPALVATHFGSPRWLRVRWTPSQWTGPRGDLVIHIQDGSGRAVPNIECRINSDVPQVHHELIDSLFATGASGDCEIRNVPAVAYTVSLHRFIDNDHWAEEAIRTFVVLVTDQGRTVNVVINELP